MAYMSQELKKKLSIGIKEVFKKHGVKGSISVRHYSTLVVKVKSGVIDFGLNERGYTTISRASDKMNSQERIFVEDMILAMNEVGDQKNHDNSDCYTDYFDVGWYTSLEIGSYDQHYLFIQNKAA